MLLACRAADVTRTTAYRWRDADPVFAEEWAEAMEDHTDLLEATAIDRAIRGTADRPPSDRLLERLLVARRPHVYSDRYVAPAVGADVPADVLEAAAVELERRIARSRAEAIDVEAVEVATGDDA